MIKVENPATNRQTSPHDMDCAQPAAAFGRPARWPSGVEKRVFSREIPPPAGVGDFSEELGNSDGSRLPRKSGSRLHAVHIAKLPVTLFKLEAWAPLAGGRA